MVAALPAAGLDMPELLIYDVQDLHRIFASSCSQTLAIALAGYENCFLQVGGVSWWS